MTSELFDNIKFDEQGLIPAIVQDAFSGRVLMLAYMNRESLERTLATGRCWFYSRSRQQLWEKGATSGNYQNVQRVQYDCDGDALLLHVQSAGPACHTGRQSCFDAEPAENASTPVAFLSAVRELAERIHARRVALPEGSYTARLLRAGPKKIAQKVGEEGLEVALAAVVENDDRLAEEAADLVYHLLVALEARGLPLDLVGEVLQKRAGKNT